ncbi:MAG: hypothetical protein GY754_17820 [bacterium]|nr:hypothetical protein [bacterium]
MKYTKTAVLCLSAFCLILFISCKSNKTSTDTDKVKISDVNSAITQEDIEAGVKKTGSGAKSVTMPHQIHEKGGVACITCHHKDFNDERIKQCSPCHKGKDGSEMYHALCIDCHKKKGAGPVSCDGCHSPNAEKNVHANTKERYNSKNMYNKEFHPVHEGAGLECKTCHHDIKGDVDKTKVKNCSVCHSGKTNKDIMHQFCIKCHKDYGSGPVKCKECHK